MLQSISRHEEDQLTIAVIQGLGSLGSSTAMGLVVVGSLVDNFICILLVISLKLKIVD